MAFDAECPFCRVKVQGVPHDLVGASAECPQCGSLFTLSALPTPSSVTAPTLLRLAKKREAAEQKATSRAPMKRLKSRIDPFSSDRIKSGETRPSVTINRARKPLLPVKRLFKAGPPRPRGKPNSFGLASLLAVAVAIYSFSIPSLNFLGTPAAGIGLIFGLVGLAVSHLKSQRFSASVAGSAVSLALLLILAWQSLRPDPASHEAFDPADPLKPSLVLAGNQVQQHRLPLKDDDWTDMSRGAFQKDDLRVRVLSVSVSQASANGGDAKAGGSGKSLLIKLKISNVGAARKIDYTHWSGSGGNLGQKLPALTDNQGKAYFILPATEPEPVKPAHVAPGKSVEDVIRFRAPPADVEYLHLELPGATVGDSGFYRLLIPKRMIN